MQAAENKCEKCRGAGKVTVVPPPAMKEKLREEIIRAYKGREREGWLKTLEGITGTCPECKGTGRKADQDGEQDRNPMR